MFSRPCQILASLLVCVLALTSCDPLPPPTGSAESLPSVPLLDDTAARVAVLLPDTSESFQLVQSQVLTLVSAQGPSIRVENFNAAGSAVTQFKQLETLLANPPFALLIRPVDSALLEPLIAEATRRNILVIGLDPQLVGRKCHTVLTCDQRQLGRLAGEIAVHALEIKSKSEGQTEIAGRVAQIRGDETSEICSERSEGFQSVLRAHPGIVLVHDAPGFWKKEEAALRMQEILRLQSSVDVVYAHNDVMAYGAAQAAGAARENMLFIGTDAFAGAEGGLTLVQNGVIDATIYQPLLVDFAWQIIRRKLKDPAFQPKPHYTLEGESVTPKNLPEKLAKSWKPYPSL